MNTSRQKKTNTPEYVIVRIVVFVMLASLVFVVPSWLVLVLAFFAALLFKPYYELCIFGVLMDVFFAHGSLLQKFPTMLLYTFISLGLFTLVHGIQSRTRERAIQL